MKLGDLINSIDDVRVWNAFDDNNNSYDNIHTVSYTIQISISLTSQNLEVTNTVNSTSYVVNPNNQNSSQVDQESTIGVNSVSTST